MLDIVHDETTPILQIPGSLTYGCVMVGMALLGLLALQSAWQSWQAQPEPAHDTEPRVPTAHW
jgi:TRAP-type C4-dicarboxylate transport system permease small subunit